MNGESTTNPFLILGRGRSVSFKTGRTKHHKNFDKMTIKVSAGM